MSLSLCHSLRSHRSLCPEIQSLMSLLCLLRSVQLVSSRRHNWLQCWQNTRTTSRGVPGKCTLIQHHIKTENYPPLRQLAYQTSPEKRREIDRQVAALTAKIVVLIGVGLQCRKSSEGDVIPRSSEHTLILSFFRAHSLTSRICLHLPWQ